jgi:hypothetical protein
VKRIAIRLLIGPLAFLYAVGMFASTLPHARDTLRWSDPVGGHGHLITLLGLVALGSLASGLFLRGSDCLRGGARPWFLLGALCWAVEAVSLLPCLLGGGSLCGVFYVVLNRLTAPGMMIAALGAAAASGRPL